MTPINITISDSDYISGLFVYAFISKLYLTIDCATFQLIAEGETVFILFSGSPTLVQL